MQKRLLYLDYLRGVAAFGIMIYHYLTWSYGSFSANSFMGRFGVYGVSLFYILSGLTLFCVYYDNLEVSIKSLRGFYIKRIFRIFPLLWLTTIVAILLSRQLPNFYILFLNLTGLFGFINWNNTFSAGVWSIGNELVFYSVFPILVFVTKKSKLLLGLIVIMGFLLYLYFAFKVINVNVALSLQWRNYVNPLNQLFLFIIGFLIGFIFRSIKIPNWLSLIFFSVGFGLFVLFPVTGDSVYLVTGVNRLIFTVSGLLFCIGFFKLTYKLPEIIHKLLTLLGETSYSIYLLHPLVRIVVPGVIVPIILTLFVSYFVHKYFEKYFISLGMRFLVVFDNFCCKYKIKDYI